MKYYIEQFEAWKDALEKFSKSVEKDLEEIRKCKDQVSAIKMEIDDNYVSGKYFRDDNKIVISAPEVIIGNVDKSGVLLPGSSNVTIRANDIQLQGVGVTPQIGGSITSKASKIISVAVDPGIDGKDEVLLNTSQIISHANEITLHSESGAGILPSDTYSMGSGINLAADSTIVIDATKSCDILKKSLDKREKQIKDRISDCKEKVRKAKSNVDDITKKIGKLVDDNSYDSSDFETRGNYDDIELIQEEFKVLFAGLYDAMSHYFTTLSELSEANRRKDALEKTEKMVQDYKSKYKTNPNGNKVDIRSECIDITSVDGDGNIRTDDLSGVKVRAKNVSFAANDYDSSLLKESKFSVSAQTIDLATVSATNIKKDSKGNISSGTYSAVGDVHIVSKNVAIESVDYQMKNDKLQEKELTRNGTVSIRTENVDVSLTETTGKATGKFDLNAKAIELKGIDVDKEKGTDKSIAAASSMLLLSDKMFIGSKDEKTKSKLVQISSDEIGAFAEKTMELQQAKGVVQLSGGDVALQGGKTQLYGATTIYGKSVFKSDVDAGDVDVKNLKVKTSFKSPCTSEGIAVPGAPASGKLTEKLKQQQAPKTEKQNK